MKPPAIIGLILIVLGIVLLIFQGIPFTKKSTADLGPVRLEEKHQETMPVSPIVGALSLAGGIFLVVLGSRK
jgi:hypothetical protein